MKAKALPLLRDAIRLYQTDLSSHADQPPPHPSHSPLPSSHPSAASNLLLYRLSAMRMTLAAIVGSILCNGIAILLAPPPLSTALDHFSPPPSPRQRACYLRCMSANHTLSFNISCTAGRGTPSALLVGVRNLSHVIEEAVMRAVEQASSSPGSQLAVGGETISHQDVVREMAARAVAVLSERCPSPDPGEKQRLCVERCGVDSQLASKWEDEESEQSSSTQRRYREGNSKGVAEEDEPDEPVGDARGEGNVEEGEENDRLSSPVEDSIEGFEIGRRLVMGISQLIATTCLLRARLLHDNFGASRAWMLRGFTAVVAGPFVNTFVPWYSILGFASAIEAKHPLPYPVRNISSMDPDLQPEIMTVIGIRLGVTALIKLYMTAALQLPVSGVLISISPSILRAVSLWKTVYPPLSLWGWAAMALPGIYALVFLSVMAPTLQVADSWAYAVGLSALALVYCGHSKVARELTFEVDAVRAHSLLQAARCIQYLISGCAYVVLGVWACYASGLVALVTAYITGEKEMDDWQIEVIHDALSPATWGAMLDFALSILASSYSSLVVCLDSLSFAVEDELRASHQQLSWCDENPIE
ncbi:MAG: hypothetical protein SGPRY_010491, partial [Prymnesium sp.]